MNRLIVVTDRTQVPPDRSLGEVLAEAGAAGLQTVLLREMDLPGTERAQIARQARELGLEVIAAHRPVAGCSGLHLPASAPPPRIAIRWGRSCHDRADLLRAAAEGAWWATLSPYAESGSKPGYGPVLDGDMFDRLPLPAYALGGITPINAADARKAGAYGVAAMGAVMRAEDPAAVVADLLRAVAP